MARASPFRKTTGKAQGFRKWRQRKLPLDLRQAVPVDQRTHLGRELRRFRLDLVTQLGGVGSLSAMHRQAVELAVQLKARCLALDFQFVEMGANAEALAPHLAKSYLSYANSLARHLMALQKSVDAERKARGQPSSTVADRLSLIGRAQPPPPRIERIRLPPQINGELTDG